MSVCSCESDNEEVVSQQDKRRRKKKEEKGKEKNGKKENGRHRRVRERTSRKRSRNPFSLFIYLFRKSGFYLCRVFAGRGGDAKVVMRCVLVDAVVAFGISNLRFARKTNEWTDAQTKNETNKGKKKEEEKGMP